jgi:thiol-disulfide isomerase/thioredoxin
MSARSLGSAVLLLSAAMLFPAAATAVEVGAAAPSLRAADAAGRELSLQSLRGQVVYVDFWASWCAPCRVAMPHYQRWQQQWAALGFTVLGVNVDSVRADAERALKRAPVSFPVLYDPQGQWAETFALPTMPTAYLIGRDGVIHYIHAGFREQDLPALEARILSLLGVSR